MNYSFIHSMQYIHTQISLEARVVRSSAPPFLFIPSPPAVVAKLGYLPLIDE